MGLSLCVAVWMVSKWIMIISLYPKIIKTPNEAGVGQRSPHRVHKRLALLQLLPRWACLPFSHALPTLSHLHCTHHPPLVLAQTVQTSRGQYHIIILPPPEVFVSLRSGTHADPCAEVRASKRWETPWIEIVHLIGRIDSLLLVVLHTQRRIRNHLSVLFLEGIHQSQ